MSHILEFSIEGLVGRSESCAYKLNRDVNIFFGSNGSGKTSLLKILHSALEGDASILKNVPFTAAEVRLFSITYDRAFALTIVQKSGPPTLKGISFAPPIDATSGVHRIAQNPSSTEISWTATPELPEDTRFHHRYLTTSRLYVGAPDLMWDEAAGMPRMVSSGFSEEELDQRFATSLTKSWGAYSATVSKEIREAQQKGLANILREALAAGSSKPLRKDALDSKRAYARVASFLSRQTGFSEALGTEERFAEKYRSDANFQSVVGDIEEVEESIEAVTARGDRLKALVNSMFGGGKGVAFSDTGVEVHLGPGKTIGLPYLSSGEKQLLYIFIDTLVSDLSAILIDEPEISMHVDWQKVLVQSMRTLNPRAQIILATHSPEVMADVADEKVFRLWQG